MSEKVKVTAAQEKVMLEIRENNSNQDALAVFIERDCWNLDFTPEQFALMLCDWYEVEPEFKSGDYVMVKWKNRDGEEMYQIEYVDEFNSIHIKSPDMGINCSGFFNTRHATPSEIAQEKERRWWSGHGREVWELKPRDLVDINDKIEEFVNISDGMIYFGSGNYSDFELVKRNIDIICFVENRLDVNTDE